MHILLYFLLTIHVIVSVLMVLVVLMQRPRSEGLGAAFGSGMTDNLFGAQTTHVLAKFTTWLGCTFFVLTLGLAMVYARIGSSNEASEIQKELLSMPVPVVTPTPAPAAGATPTPTPDAAATPGTNSAAPAAATPAAEPAPAVPVSPAAPAEAAPANPAAPAAE